MNVDFENGFEKKELFNTFNENDKKGLIFLTNLFIVIIFFIILVVCIVNKNKLLKYVGFIFIVLLSANIYYYSRPENMINILYAFSSIISSKVRTPEFLDLDYFKNHKKFENNYPSLKNEIENFIDKEGVKNFDLTRDSFSGKNSYIGSDIKQNEDGTETGWRLMTLKIGNEITNKCRENLPLIASLLEETPEVVSCVLSILEPGVMIPIHIGYYKGIIRYMLPLVVPDDKENCFLWVNGIKYSWTAGKSVLWDDIYPHKVYNNTNQVRILLYMDVIRPLEGLLEKLNLLVLKLTVNSEIVKNEIKRTEYKVKI